MNLNSPATARLTPRDRPVPNELERIRLPIERGVPQRLDFEPLGLRVVLSVATGLVRPLMKMPGDEIVIASDDQVTHRGSDRSVTSMLDESRKKAVPQLLFISGKRYAARCPLMTGHSVLVRGAVGPANAGILIWITGFSITASALVGQKVTGSWIEFAWREIKEGTDRFDSMVLRPSLRDRIFFSRRENRKVKFVAIKHSVVSPDESTIAQSGGLNWRLTHGRL